jgi:DNA-binding transcriptional LysR family regulator
VELRHLRYFVTAAETRNLSQAAQRLNVAQPALSRQIRDLEDELGFTLFERLARGIRLTPAGEAFLTGAQRVMVEVERVRNDARRIARGEAGSLSVAYNEVAFANPAVAEAIRRFRSQRPEIELTLSSLISTKQLELLERGDLDVGLLYGFPERHPDLNFVKIADYGYVIGLPIGHRLAEKDSVRLADLAGEDFVWFTSQQAFLHEPLIAACRAGGLTPRVVQEAWNPSVQLSLISVGLGVGFVHPLLSDQRVYRLHLRSVADLDLPLPLYLVWQRAASSPAAEALVATVKGLLTGAAEGP